MIDCSQHTQDNLTTIETYLRGCVGFPLPDEVISRIIADRQVLPKSEVECMSKKTRELCKADLYLWCCSLPMTFGSVEDANGVWKHKEGAIQITASDKREWREMANAIYAEYGEKVHTRKMRVINFGMSLRKHCC